VNIIFDLDGTLIDSCDGILSAITMAFQVCGITLQQPLSARLIGPPLNKLLPILANSDDALVIDPLADAFKQKYDTEGYKETIVFDGIVAMLAQLNIEGHTLYLATNKRIIPTKKIISYFSWEYFFEEIYALDLLPVGKTKADLIAHVMKIHGLDKNNTIYIGDTVADREATQANGLGYIMALWGYDGDDFSGGTSVNTPEKMNECIRLLAV
jgi:phosphoglycolate phosphatase